MIHPRARATSGSRTTVNNFHSPLSSSGPDNNQEQQHEGEKEVNIAGNHNISKLMKKKNFDKDRFHKLVTKHKELTKRNNFAQSHSWRKSTSRICSSTSSTRGVKDAKEVDPSILLSEKGEKNYGDGVLHSSIGERSMPSLTNKSLRIHRGRSALQTPLHDNGTDKSIVSLSPSFLVKANPNARKALAELATRYNQFSPSRAANWNDTHLFNEGFMQRNGR